jgi:hypothetical protein
MKNIFLSILAVIFFGCNNNSSDNKPVYDSANAIEDHPLEDTQVAPFPNGYAPPNTKIDTSESKKDSIRATQH